MAIIFTNEDYDIERTPEEIKKNDLQSKKLSLKAKEILNGTFELPKEKTGFELSLKGEQKWPPEVFRIRVVSTLLSGSDEFVPIVITK